jgi:hypothetical protein
MSHLFSRINKTAMALLVSSLALPLCATAAETYHSTLLNQTKQYDPNGKGYTLVQSFIWGKNCVAQSGKKNIAPGESTVMEIAQGCMWGGVKYNIVNDTQIIGSLSHSFRNKKFAIEISIPCDGDVCNVTGVPPMPLKAVAESSKN